MIVRRHRIHRPCYFLAMLSAANSDEGTATSEGDKEVLLQQSAAIVDWLKEQRLEQTAVTFSIAIRAELNEELLDCFHGTVSLPFEAGENRTVAVNIVDNRGIESLKVIALEGEKKHP